MIVNAIYVDFYRLDYDPDDFYVCGHWAEILNDFDCVYDDLDLGRDCDGHDLYHGSQLRSGPFFKIY